MRALGLSIDIPASKRPTLRAVLLEDSLASAERPTLADVSVVDVFEVAATGNDLAAQLKDLNVAVTARLQSLAIDAVVLRRADQAPSARNTEGPKVRLMAEGAVVAAAKAHVERTKIRNGKECGKAYGLNKEGIDSDARGIAGKAQLVTATAAALSALMADRS